MNALSESDVSADFLADMAAIVSNELSAAGYSVDPSLKPDEVVTRYCNVACRRISRRPRVVLLSKELQCPSDVKTGFDLVCDKARNGQDLRPHQSRKLADPDFADALLSDWGINHLHLGTTLEPDGFMARTGPVLLARVTAAEFYCIAIMEHGKGHHPWSKQQLLEIIHLNWPTSIASSAMKGMAPEWNASYEDIRKLRAAGVNVITQRADGTIHAPLGGGIATDGSSVAVTRDVDAIQDYCDSLERSLVTKLPELLLEADRVGIKMAPPYRFHLKLEGGRTRAVEEKTHAFVDFGRQLTIEKLS